MAVDQPFPRGTFKVELGPGEHEVSGHIQAYAKHRRVLHYTPR
jgi:hypothetical protein